MKILVSIALVLAVVTSSVAAADFSYINEESMNTMIKLLPEYKRVLSKLSDAKYSPEEVYNEIVVLLTEYNMETSDFDELMPRLYMGFVSMQMKKMGLKKDNTSEASHVLLSKEELSVIEKYMTKLEPIMGEK